MLSCSEVRGKNYSPKGRPGSTPNKGPIWQKFFCQIDVKIVVQPNVPPESSVHWINQDQGGIPICTSSDNLILL